MRLPPYHWWRTVFFLIPAIAVYTIVLGVISLVSTLVDRRGHVAHGCARIWSRLILRTTGVRVILYTLLFTILAYIAKRQIWSRIEH